MSENTNVNVPVIVDSTEDKIQNLIHYVRGQQVMIDSDLAMLSAVLRSGEAIQVSVNIMNSFVKMRRFMAENALMFDKLNSLELK